MDTIADQVEIAGSQPSQSPTPSPTRRPRRHRPTKPKLISRSQIDQRTQAYKVFSQIAGAVTADLGGRDQLSAVEATLVESFAGIAVMLDDYNVRTLLGEKVDPYAYCQISSTLVRVASRLGLQRRARDVSGPTLGDLMREDIAQQQQREAEQQSEGEQ